VLHCMLCSIVSYWVVIFQSCICCYCYCSTEG
jgi:hypothetical protein